VAGPVARQSAWALGSSAGTAVLQSATTALLARFLAPADFGTASIVAIVAGLASALALLGLGAALTQARETTREDAAAVLGVSLALAALLAVTLAGVVGPLLGRALDAPALPGLVALAALALPLSAFQGVAIALLQRRLAFDVLARLQLAAVVGNAVLSLALAAAGGGVLALVVGRLLADAVVLPFALRCADAPLRPRLDATRAARFVRFGVPVAGTQVLIAAGSQIDTAVLAATLGVAALGQYALAFTLVMLPAVRLASVVKAVAFAALSRSAPVGAAFERQACSLLRQVSATCCPLALGLAVVAGDLVPLVLGPGWSDVSQLVVCLTPAGVVAAFGSAMGAVLLARGRPKVELGFAVFRVVALGALVYAGGRRAGAVGAALGVSAYHLFGFPLLFVVLQRFAGLPPARVASALAPGLVASLGMVLVVAVAGALVPGAPGTVRLALQVCVGALSYAALLRLGFPTAWDELRATAREARARTAGSVAPAAAG